jgi:hypothetical protein
MRRIIAVDLAFARTAAAVAAAVLLSGVIVYPQGLSGLATAKPEANGGKSNNSIPMSTYSFVATKSRSKKPYTGTLVGTSPFASTLSGSTIPVVVVPVVVVNGIVFDPTAPNYCGSEAVSTR